MTAPLRILVVDDERPIQRLLEITLGTYGYQVTTAASGAEGRSQAATNRPDAIILDLGLPDMEGIEVLRNVREWSEVPIVVLSARTTEEEIVRCLDAGADDYLVKPFRTNELLARLRAALRHRAEAGTASALSFGNVHFDRSARRVTKNGEDVHLTALEYAVFSCLANNAGRILTHGQILQKVWGPTFVEETQYLRVYVAQLRKKLEADPSNPRLIITESGIGYRLNENPG